MTDHNETEQDTRAEGRQGEAPDDGRDWRQAYLREVAQSKRYRQRAQEAEAGAPSDAERLEYDRRIEALEGTIGRIAGTGELMRALAACGVGSGCAHGERMLAQASALLAGRIDVVLSGGTPAVRVLDDAGLPTYDEDGQPLTVSRFVAGWLAEEGSHFLPASGDTGSGAFRGCAPPAGVSIEQLDRDPREKAKFIAKHGPQAYVQLARPKRQPTRPPQSKS